MSEHSAFTCRLCGHCCQGEGGIVLAEGDIVRLAAHLGLAREAFLAEATQQVAGKYRLISRADGYCLFFVAGTGCGVHPARPDICRAWPYFRGNLIDPVSWEMSQDFCPGIDPAVPHAEFARHGLDYLRRHGLCRSSGTCPAAGPDAPRQSDTPEALVVDAPAAPEQAPPAADPDRPQGTAPHAS